MSYIDRNLLAGEQILFRTKKHKIVFFFPVIWTIFAIYAGNYMHESPILIKLEWIPLGLGLLFWLYSGLDYMTSEFAVTNKRVMMREGFFTRHTNEMRVSAISQINVEQSLLGQILGFGTVSIQAFGAFDAFTLIARPIGFQQCVNEQLDRAINPSQRFT